MEVVEAMDGAPRNAEDVAGAELVWLAADGHGERAFKAVEGLLISIVAVGDGDFGSGGDFRLEHGDRVSGGAALQQESDDGLSEMDDFGRAGHLDRLSFVEKRPS